MEQLVVLPWLRVVVVVEYLEEELVVALLENDDDEREEEIIFAGERTRIVKTGICYGVFLSKKKIKKEQKRKRKKNERVYLNPNCNKP